MLICCFVYNIRLRSVYTANVQYIHKYKMEHKGAYLSVKKCKRKFIVSEYLMPARVITLSLNLLTSISS